MPPLSRTPDATDFTPDEWIRNSQTEPEVQQIEEETKRKKLQVLKQEEKELKGWIEQHYAVDQKPQEHESLNRYSSSSSAHEPSQSALGLKQIRKKSAPPKEIFFGGITKRFNNTKRRTSENGDVNSDVDIESQSRRVPSVPARVLFRKIVRAILTDLDDVTLQREDTETVLVVITLIKEAMLGIIIAFAAVSFFLFLDHRFLLNHPTARNFRRGTFHLMNDKETLRNFEEDSGYKFMEVEEYTGIQNEIDKAANRTQLAGKILETRSQDFTQVQKELSEYIELKAELLSSLDMDFDKFCPGCKWGEFATCQRRVNILVKTYQISKYQAMLATMANGLCQIHDDVDSFSRDEQQKAQKVIEDELLVNWDQNKKDFCLDCEWDSSMTCLHRVAYINHRYGVSMKRAGAMCMVENPRCRKSYHAEANRYGGEES